MTYIKLASWFLILWVVMLGCTNYLGMHESAHLGHKNADAEKSKLPNSSVLKLSPTTQKAHREIMHEHLETIYAIVSTLADGNFSKAEHITMTQLGFSKHREAMQQLKPEAFPPAYHDLSMAHHKAAEELAQAMRSHDLKEIFPFLERTLLACVACHRSYVNYRAEA